MLHHAPLFILALTALVHALSPPGGFYRITDFGSRSVDLHESNVVDFNPIQSFPSSAGNVAQNWLLQSTGLPNQFRVSHASAFNFASYTTAPIGGSPNRAQVCAHPTAITLWNITATGTGGAFSIRESRTGLALTAWPFQPALALATSPLPDIRELFPPTLSRIRRQERWLLTFQGVNFRAILVE
ncbi:hypothetical protein DFH06DRAFT_1143853 [Mycena polygramma]|nr:hypothetical protein DFH06DRAFT_1143853 [Mycena polygramma]